MSDKRDCVLSHRECEILNSGIDPCVKSLVKALNDGGLKTIASCCGHGLRPPSVVLSDGREIIILPNRDIARAVDHFLDEIGFQGIDKQLKTNNPLCATTGGTNERREITHNGNPVIVEVVK